MSTLGIQTISNTSRSRRPHTNAPSRAVAVIETAVLIAIVILLVVGVVATSGRGTGHSSQVHSTRVFVTAGETAWTVAQAHPIPGLTTEQVAEQIQQLNHTQGGLPANTAIVIPTPVAASTALACR